MVSFRVRQATMPAVSAMKRPAGSRRNSGPSGYVLVQRKLIAVEKELAAARRSVTMSKKAEANAQKLGGPLWELKCNLLAVLATTVSYGFVRFCMVSGAREKGGRSRSRLAHAGVWPRSYTLFAPPTSPPRFRGEWAKLHRGKLGRGPCLPGGWSFLFYRWCHVCSQLLQSSPNQKDSQ
jgi:hypothetical protein